MNAKKFLRNIWIPITRLIVVTISTNPKPGDYLEYLSEDLSLSSNSQTGNDVDLSDRGNDARLWRLGLIQPADNAQIASAV